MLSCRTRAPDPRRHNVAQEKRHPSAFNAACAPILKVPDFVPLYGFVRTSGRGISTRKERDALLDSNITGLQRCRRNQPSVCPSRAPDNSRLILRIIESAVAR